MYDVIIVGGGPAGLSAAIYAARAKYRVLVVEKAAIGGQITITAEVVNYPGISRISGKELTEKMHRQAEDFGAEFLIAEVLDMELNKDIKVLYTTKGEYRALGVILAVGANPRKLGFKGEREFQGRGVAYCATCDGEFFQGMDIFVIGGGFAAVEEGIFLTKYAKSVTMIVREEDFTCARTVSDQIKNFPQIKVIFETEIVEAGGEDTLSFARFRDNKTGKEWTHDGKKNGPFGIFVFAGYVPATRWIGAEVEKNSQGYLITDADGKTNLTGVYGAGDVCVKNLRQVVTAVADGAIAATALEKVVSELHGKLEIPDLAGERKASEASSGTDDGKEEQEYNGFFSDEIRNQLKGIADGFEEKIILRAWLDKSSLADEILGFLRELEGISKNILWEQMHPSNGDKRILPSIEICREDGSSSGIQFHGVPGGHEFTSFVIAMYNVAGKGQEISREAEEKIRSIKQPVNLKILVSLSCTMCPETVMSAGKAAAISKEVEAEMFDLAHFPEWKEKYSVMSVPCLIVNDETVLFGKKGIEELAGIIG